MDFNATLQAIFMWLQQAADQAGLWIGGVIAGWRAQPTVAFSAALAALAAVLALASISQSRRVRRRLENVKNDFFAAFRPKCIVRDVYAPHFNPGEPIEVRYTVCNVGGSPAKIVESAIAVEVLRSSGLALVPECNGQNPVGEIQLDPGEVHHFGYRSPDVNWEKNFIRAGSANAPRLVFAGQLGYLDQRGVRRRTSFCRSFDVKRERFYPIGDSELEYAD